MTQVGNPLPPVSVQSYWALPSGGYVVAVVACQDLLCRAQSKPVTRPKWVSGAGHQPGWRAVACGAKARPAPPLVGPPCLPSLQHYVSRQLDGHWVQAMPLLNSPTVSLVYVASLLHIGRTTPSRSRNEKIRYNKVGF